VGGPKKARLVIFGYGNVVFLETWAKAGLKYYWKARRQTKFGRTTSLYIKAKTWYIKVVAMIVGKTCHEYRTHREMAC